MSKGLEALKRYRFLPTAIDCDIIEKELTVLEIIDKKDVGVGALKELDFEHYNMYARDILGVRTLTKEEYDLLKEVLL